MNHKGTIQLESERLIFRQFKLEDAKQMYENWASLEIVTTYLTWKPHTSESATKEIISLWKREYRRKDFYQWAIILKENDENIGVISVVDSKEHISSVTIGYCLSDLYWNHGYMTEALERVMEFFFEEVGVNRVESKHSVYNPASGRVMQKAGLIKEGVIKQGDMSNIGLSDLVVYGLVKEDYNKQKRSL